VPPPGEATAGPSSPAEEELFDANEIIDAEMRLIPIGVDEREVEVNGQGEADEDANSTRPCPMPSHSLVCL
jgi:hypothetical protein